MMLIHALLIATLGCGAATASASAPVSHPGKVGVKSPHQISWDNAFKDQSGSHPVHFIAIYQDSHGTSHHLEEWRQATEHLRRRTDDRIDLHADAMIPESRTKAPKGQPEEYVWQVIDLEKKVLHRVSTQGMLHAGMMYDFWSTAHVLVRPAGHVEVTQLPAETAIRVAPLGCKWFRIEPDEQPATRVCWAGTIGAPLRIDAQDKAGEWKTIFETKVIDRAAIAPSVFRVNSSGLEVRNVDDFAAED